MDEPVAVISKGPLRPKSPQRIHPSITVYVGKSEDVTEFGGLRSLTEQATGAFATLLRQYRVMDPICEYEISSCRAKRVKASFLFERRDMEPVVVDAETHVIEQAKRYYTIHLFDSLYEGELAQEELSDFLDSLRIL